jgi:plasmid stabilization system protein ParE
MPRVIWSPAALNDVQRHYRFLAEKNKGAAQRAVKAIRERVRILADHAEIGRPAEEMEPEYREWLVDFGDSGYIALSHFGGQTAVIVAIRHQKEAGYHQ